MIWALVLLTASAARATALQEPPEAHDLPAVEADLPPGGPLSAAGLDVLEATALGRGGRRADAILELRRRSSLPARRLEWTAARSASKVLEALAARPDDDEFRRRAIYELFSAYSAELRRVPLLGAPAGYEDAWRRLDEFRRREVRDRDPRVAGFFERYQDCPGAPNWRRSEADARRSLKRASELHPDKAAAFADVLRSEEGVEKRILDELRGSVARIDGSPEAAPGRRRAAAAELQATADARLLTTWANLHPRVMIEMLGKAEGEALAGRPIPVCLGWPALLGADVPRP